MWIDIFQQIKPSLSGFSGLDLVAIKQILEIHGLELNEKIYNRIKFVEDLYRTKYSKDTKDVT